MARELASVAPMAVPMTLCGSALIVPNPIGVNVFAGIASLNEIAGNLGPHLMVNLPTTLLRHHPDPLLSLPPDRLLLLATNLALLHLTMMLPGLMVASAHLEVPPDLQRSPVLR